METKTRINATPLSIALLGASYFAVYTLIMRFAPVVPGAIALFLLAGTAAFPFFGVWKKTKGKLHDKDPHTTRLLMIGTAAYFVLFAGILYGIFFLIFGRGVFGGL